MGTQEPLDSSYHGAPMAVLLKIPHPLLTGEVGLGQPETHNDKKTGKVALGVDSGCRVSQLRDEFCIFALQILNWRQGDLT